MDVHKRKKLGREVGLEFAGCLVNEASYQSDCLSKWIKFVMEEG